MPFRRIFKKKLVAYLKISEDDLNRAEELRIRQVSEKLNRSNKEETNNKGETNNKENLK